MAGDAAAAGGAGGALRARASLVTVDVLTGHICSVSFCLYVPTERDKYVWLVQSRRRPVDQDLEGGLTRQCNTRPSFLIMCCLWESRSQDDLPQFLLLLPQAARDGLALCHLLRLDTSRGVPSQGRHRSKVCACRR